MLFAAIDFTFIIPILVFVAFVGAVWGLLSMISNRNSRAQERLARLSRPQSLADIDLKMPKKERFQGVVETAKALSGPLMPGTELEQSALKTKLANAGFRSDSAVAVYLGLRFGSLLFFLLISLAYALPKHGFVLRGHHAIRIRVLDEIPYETFAGLSTEELTARVRDVFVRELGEDDAALPSAAAR